MKFLKSFSCIILAIVIFLAPLMGQDYNTDVYANRNGTLRDLKNELAEWERRAVANQQQQQATQAEISAARTEITNAAVEIERIEEEIVEINEDIVQLNEDIQLKNEQLREIMVFYQLTAHGENAILEYLFSAADFTDFIYRMAIAEQLGNHNRRLIDEYEALITKAENLRRELAERISDLESRRRHLETRIGELQHVLAGTVEGAVGIEDEIAALRNLITHYEDVLQCGLDQLITVCLEERNSLPPDTAFWRPLATGRVSSEWGYRTLWGRREFHWGIDFAAPRLTPVYSSANGRVAHIFHRASCGGNMVFINHVINGRNYTTGYYHLATVNVSLGQIVTSNTVIGTVGGSSQEWWDRCSTGAHLHFQVARGHYMIDFSSIAGFNSRSFNPRTVVNAPPTNVHFNNRTRRF